MPITGRWEKDKGKELTSLEDLELYYFDKAEFVDRNSSIISSFENFTTDDLDSGGHIVRAGGGIYDELSDDSVEQGDIPDNYPGLFYYDESMNNRIYFRFNSSNFVEEGGYEGVNGNIGSPGELITISSSIAFNGTFRIFQSEKAIISYSSTGVPVQVLGRCWLSNTIDDDEYGVDWDVSLYDTSENNAQWSVTRSQWTESDITINKAVFWSRDLMAPGT